jgi:metallo-beta-lactamase family protein
MYDCNAGLPLPPSDINGVFLTHAHVDHCGRLPRLVQRGFRGPVFATKATIELCRLLLADSAYVLKSQTSSLNQRRLRRGLPELPELYSDDDVEQTLRQMVPVQWFTPFTPAAGITVEFLPAGHILGAASIVIRDNECSVAYSGDLGRHDDWLLQNPALPTGTDYVILESTYGDRQHRPYSYAQSQLSSNLAATVAAGGVVVIPAFSVGRSQRIIYELRALMAGGQIPDVPIYLDSPLSIKASAHFMDNADELREDPRELLGDDFLDCHTVATPEESRMLLRKPGPYIVITASGMCEAGRVLYHLERSLPDPRSRIMFVGFCAEDTLGRQLIDGSDMVKINGRAVSVRATIDYFDTFSAHADQDGLTAWACAQKDVKGIFLVHGEEDQAFALAERLENEGSWEIAIPFSGEAFDVTSTVMRCAY